MAKAALLFNGIRYSFEVAQRAIEWAKEKNGSLIAIFLKSKNEIKEGYVFPSDLDQAEILASTDDAETSNIRVIKSYIRVLENLAENEHILLETKLITDPSEDELLSHLAGCEIIFMNDNIEEPGILTVESIDLKKMRKVFDVPVEIVQ